MPSLKANRPSGPAPLRHYIAEHTNASARADRHIWPRMRKSSLIFPTHLTERFQYFEGLVERAPDIYLCELRNLLLKVFDIDIDEATVSLASHERGYTSKTVCFVVSLPLAIHYVFPRSLALVVDATKRYVTNIKRQLAKTIRQKRWYFSMNQHEIDTLQSGR